MVWTIVDTGAFLSVIPTHYLQKIGLKPLRRRRFTLANGEKIEKDVGIAIFQWNGFEGAWRSCLWRKRG